MMSVFVFEVRTSSFGQCTTWLGEMDEADIPDIWDNGKCGQRYEAYDDELEAKIAYHFSLQEDRPKE